jgi:hypothetical protein
LFHLLFKPSAIDEALACVLFAYFYRKSQRCSPKTQNPWNLNMKNQKVDKPPSPIKMDPDDEDDRSQIRRNDPPSDDHHPMYVDDDKGEGGLVVEDTPIDSKSRNTVSHEKLEALITQPKSDKKLVLKRNFLSSTDSAKDIEKAIDRALYFLEGEHLAFEWDNLKSKSSQDSETSDELTSEETGSNIKTSPPLAESSGSAPSDEYVDVSDEKIENLINRMEEQLQKRPDIDSSDSYEPVRCSLDDLPDAVTLNRLIKGPKKAGKVRENGPPLDVIGLWWYQQLLRQREANGELNFPPVPNEEQYIESEWGDVIILQRVREHAQALGISFELCLQWHLEHSKWKWHVVYLTEAIHEHRRSQGQDIETGLSDGTLRVSLKQLTDRRIIEYLFDFFPYLTKNMNIKYPFKWAVKRFELWRKKLDPQRIEEDTDDENPEYTESDEASCFSWEPPFEPIGVMSEQGGDENPIDMNRAQSEPPPKLPLGLVHRNDPPTDDEGENDKPEHKDTRKSKTTQDKDRDKKSKQREQTSPERSNAKKEDKRRNSRRQKSIDAQEFQRIISQQDDDFAIAGSSSSKSGSRKEHGKSSRKGNKKSGKRDHYDDSDDYFVRKNDNSEEEDGEEDDSIGPATKISLNNEVATMTAYIMGQIDKDPQWVALYLRDFAAKNRYTAVLQGVLLNLSAISSQIISVWANAGSNAQEEASKKLIRGLHDRHTENLAIYISTLEEQLRIFALPSSKEPSRDEGSTTGPQEGEQSGMEEFQWADK